MCFVQKTELLETLPCLFLFLCSLTSLVLQVVGQPLQTLIETISRGGAGCLDVPLTLTKSMKSELIGNLGSVHGIGQILLVGENQQKSITKLVLAQHARQLITGLINTITIVGIDNEDNTLSVLEVYGGNSKK